MGVVFVGVVVVVNAAAVEVAHVALAWMVPVI